MASRTPKTPADAQDKPAVKTASTKRAKPVEKPALKVVEAPSPEAGGGPMKLRELIEAVASSTGGRKPDVKAAVEATLSALGEALATGKALVLPPLGKLRVVKTNGPALTLKLRLPRGAKAAGLALADDGEDS